MRLYKIMLAFLCALAIPLGVAEAKESGEQLLESQPVRATLSVIPGETGEKESIKELLAPYRQEVAKWEAPIGESKVELEVRSEELGAWAADTLLASLRRQGKDVDFVVINTGGLRTTLSEGPVSYRTVASLMPFGNTATTFELKGEQMETLMAFLAENGGGVFPIAGAEIWATEDKELIRFEIGGEPFDPEKTYRMVTSNYLAEGNSGFEFYKEWNPIWSEELIRDHVAEQIKHMTSQGKVIDKPEKIERFHYGSQDKGGGS